MRESKDEDGWILKDGDGWDVMIRRMGMDGLL